MEEGGKEKPGDSFFKKLRDKFSYSAHVKELKKETGNDPERMHTEIVKAKWIALAASGGTVLAELAREHLQKVEKLAYYLAETSKSAAVYGYDYLRTVPVSEIPKVLQQAHMAEAGQIAAIVAGVCLTGLAVHEVTRWWDIEILLREKLRKPKEKIPSVTPQVNKNAEVTAFTCPNCGAPLVSGAKTCSSCASGIKWAKKTKNG